MRRKRVALCFSCGDPVTDKDNAPYCDDCHSEKTEGKIPNVTGPTAPPAGTGTIERQRHGRGKTSS